MNKTSTGWIMFIASIGMMSTLSAADVARLNSMHDALTPTFISSVLAHLGTVITAFIAGKIIPPDRDPNAHDRKTDA